MAIRLWGQRLMGPILAALAMFGLIIFAQGVLLSKDIQQLDLLPGSSALEGASHFTAQFELPPETSQSLLIPRVSNFALAYLNGEQVAQVRYQPAVLHNIGFRPLYLTLPPALLREQNRIDLLVGWDHGEQRQRSAVLVGSPGAIEQRFYTYWFMQTGTQIIGVTASILTILFSIVMWRGTRELVYRDFAIAAAALLIHLGLRLMLASDQVSWLSAWCLSLTWFAFIGGMTYGAFVMTGELAKQWRRRCAGFVVLATVASAFAAFVGSLYLYEMIVFSGYVVAAAAGALVVVRAVPERRWTSRYFGTAMILAALIAAAEVVMLVSESGTLGNLSYAQLGTMIILATGVVFVLDQHVQAASELRSFNAALESRVRQSESELRRVYDELVDKERQTAVVSERHRIVREMHDGLGGQLVATMALLQGETFKRGDISRAIDTCLTELRLAIDSLEPAHSDLVNALAALRFRLDPVLNQSGIDLTWSVRSAEHPRPMTPEQVLQIFRIFQEAITNVIKHSDASRVSLRCAYSERLGATWITLTDNGRPTEHTANAKGGYGLRNMRSRAEAIGAELSIRLASQRRAGSQIRLIWGS